MIEIDSVDESICMSCKHNVESTEENDRFCEYCMRSMYQFYEEEE